MTWSVGPDPEVPGLEIHILELSDGSRFTLQQAEDGEWCWVYVTSDNDVGGMSTWFKTLEEAKADVEKRVERGR